MMKPGMLAPWVMALLSTVGIAFVGLANASPLAVAQQERVNQDANAFKLSSMVSAELFAAGTAPARDAVDADAPHGMGALPITEERLAKEKKEGRGIKKIRLNKIGLARVNAERAKKGQSALVAGVDLQV
ncbi:MAG TPA: hypothetical protein DCS43_04325, partial [Verrucomicrobia bacterium]|nr:hypothetical protein [Verrucomicrobiota bacterium]